MTSVAVSAVPRRTGRDYGRRPVRAPRWHLAACWRALESVVDELGDPPRYRRYVQLATGREDLPSPSTVRQRLGSWPHIAAALQARNDDLRPEECSLDNTLGSAPRNTSGTRADRSAAAADAAGRLPSRVAVGALGYLAAHPGASGVAVKEGTGIRQYSQVNGLLARLEREGLAARERNGAANAWTLTEHGIAVLKTLPGELSV